MEQSIEELADYIVKDIEQEDFKKAYKKYGSYKIRAGYRKILKWWNEL